MLFRNYTTHTSVNLVFINNQLETLHLSVHQLHAFIAHSPRHRDSAFYLPMLWAFLELQLHAALFPIRFEQVVFQIHVCI